MGGAKTTTIMYPSVRATETILMAALVSSSSSSTIVIENAAKEPEVVDLVGMLRKVILPALSHRTTIQGEGTDRIEIIYQKEKPAYTQDQPRRYTIIPDRIEAGTLLIAAAAMGATEGNKTVRLAPVERKHLDALLNVLSHLGYMFTYENNNRILEMREKQQQISSSSSSSPPPLHVTTGPFPGYPTDLQPPLVALLSCCTDSRHIPETSVVRETVFEARFENVRELQQLGADIKIEGHKCRITRRTKRNQQEKQQVQQHLYPQNLRDAAALLVAAISVSARDKEQQQQQPTVVLNNLHHLRRGYQREFHHKLNAHFGTNIVEK